MKIKATAPAIQSIIDKAPRPSLIVVGVRFDTSFMFSSVLSVLNCMQSGNGLHAQVQVMGAAMTSRNVVSNLSVEYGLVKKACGFN